jgi:penicillin-insensitive murein DD-endopeptidase
MKRALALFALGAAGCFGTPVPLAPGVGGSVGAPHHGVLTVAVELPPKGPGFVRYRPLGSYNWGNPRLVKTVERAANAVSEKAPGGSPLIIGDLSAKGGGKIPRHQSHRTGRDVDLPWFVTTPQGVPLQNPGFVNMGPDGLARLETTGEYVRLDVEREWLLVKELLTSPEADVEWMFASKEVEALLVDYARARGEAPSLLWRAETVLIQPGNTLAHDDHIHLRIACTPDEAVLGCEGGGPRWEWLAPLPSLPSDDTFLYEVVREDPLPKFVDTGVAEENAPAVAPGPREAAPVRSPVTGEPANAPSG